MLDANQAHITLAIPAVDNDLQVLSFEGRETLNKPYRFTIELVSQRADLDLDGLINQTAYLAFGSSGRGVHGVIYGIEQGDSGKRLTRYRIDLRPTLAYLGHSFDQRIFQHMTAPAIIAAVLEEHGLLDGSDYRFQLGPYVYPERIYCTQYEESDLHFIQRLCEEEGIGFHFQHGEDGHVLVFGDDASAFPRLDPLNYQQGSGLAADHEVVRAFGVRLETRSTLASWRDYDFEQPRLLMEAGYASEFTPTLEVYDYPGRFTDRTRGKHLARRSLERLRSDYELAEGKSDAFLACGHFLALAGHPRQQWNDLWLLNEVIHEGKQPQVLEESITSDLTLRRSAPSPLRGEGWGEGEKGDSDFHQGYRNRFTATPWDIPYRPALEHHKPKVLGSQTAVVTGPAGEEIHCDQYGRVKVQFHWDRDGQADDTTSCWLRVASNWAGKAYGGIAIPRVGMEVLVTFLEGDPDQPLVTGCLYHAEHLVPYDLPAHKTRSLFKTLSSPGGGGYNEFRIEDRKGAEQIYIHAQRDWDENIEHDQKIRVGNERHDTVEANSYTELKAEEHRTTDLDRKVEVRANDHLTVASTQHNKIGTGLFVEAGNEIHYNAGSKVVIDAGMELTATGGGSFLKLDPSGVTLSGATIKMNSGGGPGSGSGLKILAPRLPNAADRDRPGSLLAPPRPQPVLSFGPLCGKQSDGACSRGDCPCMKG
ncbi:type VI secretion system Vgr family protein [Pseudomonas sp. SP16.1]|uniref:type VI secretion system Vgr family protein n=1 Tax=Pseudomonas sp. SP16.1 TaxID=3458854 RepID=UPI004045D1F3